MKTRVVKLLASGGGTGYIRPASGTWGTLVAAIIAYLIWLLAPNFFLSPIAILFVAAGILISVSIASTAVTSEPDAGKDPHWIVIDEIVGLFTALVFGFDTLAYLIAAFFIFRFFDITKPFPARQAEDLPSGWGIVLDDVIAGIYTNFTLQLLVWVTSNF